MAVEAGYADRTPDSPPAAAANAHGESGPASGAIPTEPLKLEAGRGAGDHNVTPSLEANRAPSQLDVGRGTPPLDKNVSPAHERGSSPPSDDIMTRPSPEDALETTEGRGSTAQDQSDLDPPPVLSSRREDVEGVTQGPGDQLEEGLVGDSDDGEESSDGGDAADDDEPLDETAPAGWWGEDAFELGEWWCSVESDLKAWCSDVDALDVAVAGLRSDIAQLEKELEIAA